MLWLCERTWCSLQLRPNDIVFYPSEQLPVRRISKVFELFLSCWQVKSIKREDLHFHLTHFDLYIKPTRILGQIKNIYGSLFTEICNLHRDLVRVVGSRFWGCFICWNELLDIFLIMCISTTVHIHPQQELPYCFSHAGIVDFPLNVEHVQCKRHGRNYELHWKFY